MNFGNVIVYMAVVLDGVAGACYCVRGDYPRTVYWIAAAILTGSTVFIR